MYQNPNQSKNAKNSKPSSPLAQKKDKSKQSDNTVANKNTYDPNLGG